MCVVWGVKSPSHEVTSAICMAGKAGDELGAAAAQLYDRSTANNLRLMANRNSPPHLAFPTSESLHNTICQWPNRHTHLNSFTLQ